MRFNKSLKKFILILATFVVVLYFKKTSILNTAKKQDISFKINENGQKIEIIEPKELEFLPSTFKDTHIEGVKFYAKKSENSNKLIARRGLLTLRKSPKANLLICHGYLCDKIEVSVLRTFFPDFNVLIFDFRAHGEKNEKECCTMGKKEAFDVIAAAKFLRENPSTKDLKLFGYGFSMGASSLIEAQAKEKLFDGLVLDCPFDSSRSIVKTGFNRLKINLFGYSFDIPGIWLLEKYAFNAYIQPVLQFIFKNIANMDSTKTNTKLYEIEPSESIKKIEVPCFFIHCHNDEKISVDAIKKIFNNAPGYKKLWLTHGRKHCDSLLFHPEKYFYITNSFLNDLVSENLPQHENGIILDDFITNF